MPKVKEKNTSRKKILPRDHSLKKISQRAKKQSLSKSKQEI